MLQTDQQFPGLDNLGDVKANADGSYDIYFAPKAPVGKESNWIQTVPGKGWNTILRLYGPLESFYDKSWKPGDPERPGGLQRLHPHRRAGRGVDQDSDRGDIIPHSDPTERRGAHTHSLSSPGADGAAAYS